MNSFIKNILLHLLLIVSVLSIEAQSSKFFSIHPLLPKQGDTISFVYTGKLASLPQTRAILYYMVHDQLYAKEVETYQGSKGSVQIPDSAAAVAFAFKNEQRIDTNNGNGFIYQVYRDQKPIEGSLFSSSLFFVNPNAFTIGLKPNYQKALGLQKKEFALYPSSLTQHKISYLYMLARAGHKDAVKKELPLVFQMYLSKYTQEKELQDIQCIYEVVYDEKGSDSIEQLIIKKFPGGSTAVIKDIHSLATPNTDDLFIEKLVKLKERYPNADFYSGSIGLSYSWNFFSYLMQCATQLDTVHFNRYIDEVSEPKLKAKLNYTIAEQILNKGGDHLVAKKYSESALEAIKALQKPSYLTEKDWKQEVSALYVPYAYTYALILNRAGMNSEALRVLKEIIDIDASQPQMNEQYVKYLLQSGADSSAMHTAENFIKTGKSNRVIDSLFKVIYVRIYPMEDVNRYFASLSDTADKNMIQVLKGKMVSLPPKYFKLEDINGKMVSLKALKGKIVVLDFWAHWCKPCKEAFEGMQLAVNKFSNDLNVVFLFINTAERTKLEDRKRQTINYLKTHNYNFQVLFDEQIGQSGNYKGIMDYDVGAIPAKFVLDKNGRVRFKAVGYNGDANELAKEMEKMIELVREVD